MNAEKRMILRLCRALLEERAKVMRLTGNDRTEKPSAAEITTADGGIAG